MATFQYACPETLTEAVGLASSNPGYSWIAGGTDFMVKLRLKRIEPSITIDIGRLEELRQIRLEKETLYIGAAVTHTELTTSPLIGQYAPALKEAAGMVGSPQIRNRGTVGGNICNASPAADTVPVLLAYGAKVLICGKTGQRRLELADFCTGPGRTILKSGEFLREIYFPVQRLRQGSSFQKLGKRKALAISVVNAAAWLELDDQTVKAVRLALGSVAAKTIRIPQAEEVLTGQVISPQIIHEAAMTASQVIHPIDDVRSEAEYRKSVAAVLIRQALEKSWQQAVKDL